MEYSNCGEFRYIEQSMGYILLNNLGDASALLRLHAWLYICRDLREAVTYLE